MRRMIPIKSGGPQSGVGWSGAPRSMAGFTLIEVLTAMMILAISMVMIMQLFSGGLKAEKLSGDYNRAIMHARATMEEALLRETLEEGIVGGEFDDGFRWKTEVAPHQPADEEPDEDEEENPRPIPVELLEVTVEVGWTSGERERTFRIQTLAVVESDGDD